MFRQGSNDPENTSEIAAKTESAAQIQAQTLPQTGTSDNLPPSDPELAEVVAAWPKLSPEQRAGVLVIVRG
jgi:hypothetical protein